MKLPNGYAEFLKPDCDRKNFIQNWLKKNNINSSVIVLGGKNHIYVDFSSNNYDKRFKIKTLVAHYDRVENTAGANDNSSGVFALLEAALYLKELSILKDEMQKSSKQNFSKADFQNFLQEKSILRDISFLPKDFCHNTRIIFTDGEESGRFSVAEQGAFLLAKRLKELNSFDDEVYVFDCVGRGDIPVISEVDFSSKVDRNFSHCYDSLLNHAKVAIEKSYFVNGFSNLVLPTAFSDNASFIANGIPSVLITMIPRDEVINYMSNLRRISGLKESVLHRKLEDIPNKIAPEYILRESVPLTWRYFHTEFDNITTLTPSSFLIINKIIREIININYLR